jgi:hypothetical protein
VVDVECAVGKHAWLPGVELPYQDSDGVLSGGRVVRCRFGPRWAALRGVVRVRH